MKSYLGSCHLHNLWFSFRYDFEWIILCPMNHDWFPDSKRFRLYSNKWLCYRARTVVFCLWMRVWNTQMMRSSSWSIRSLYDNIITNWSSYRITTNSTLFWKISCRFHFHFVSPCHELVSVFRKHRTPEQKPRNRATITQSPGTKTEESSDHKQKISRVNRYGDPAMHIGIQRGARCCRRNI